MDTKAWTTTSLALVLVLGWTPASGAEDDRAPGESGTVEQQPEPGWSWWLRADEQYRMRAVVAPGGDPASLLDPSPDDESDHDLRMYLGGGFRSPGDSFGAELAAALWYDLDGEVPAGDPGGLGQVTDYRQPWWDVYTLTADYRSEGILRLAKVGRQAAPHGLPVTFDGAAAEISTAGPYLDLFVFGGRSVHFFETRQDLFEDWIGSLGLISRPLRELKLELDYRFEFEDVEPNNDPGSVDKDALVDHTYGLTAWYRPGEWLLLRARLRGLDAALSHAGGAARLSWPGLDLGADLAIDAQLVNLGMLSEREDPFYAILGESRPHLRWRLDLWKLFPTGFGDFGLHLGWAGRQVTEGDEDAFNQSLNRLYLEAEASDVFVRGLYARLLVEGLFSHLDDRLTGDLELALGGAAGYRFWLLKAEIGTFYQRVKYDYYRDLEVKNDVRTTYLDLTFSPLDWLRLRARYEYELSDRDVHGLFLTVSQVF